MEEALTITRLEETYMDDLNLLDDWFLQYEYLLEISSDLPHIPKELRTEENKVHGCQSGVWLLLSEDNGRIYVQADSEALIIRGMLAVIVSLLNGRKADEIVCYTPRFIEETNLKTQISTDRFHGIHEVIKNIQNFAGKKKGA
ncbi:Uncharacterized sufE-like protein ygdK [uncultured Roseburia sp.]|uniref:SufE family protein n=1 Tax=Brotonthovivens ammoniilytica TaxID=2981725 RepID=A0ABT2TIK4_9FIRM|nr:SufE family protein [Brotonthovivens ammoniilytica]MCU6761462.1 SufE family protein [Brotonthovivens ammoniilytica]SCI29182.1 Uncharacterized sufE-like protein ygdK [uncultured Roseburia sp.]